MRETLRKDLAAVLCIGIAAIVFYSPVLFGGYWLPARGGDLASFLYPNYRFAAQTLQAGTLPLWNPYLYAGAPFLADNQSGVFYPINLLAFLLGGTPSYNTLQGLVIFHTWFAGVGLFALARANSSTRWGAIIGAVAFMLCDVFITHIGNLNLNAAASWLPWIILCLAKATANSVQIKRQMWLSVLAGALFSASVLAGHAQMSLYLAYAVALFFFVRLLACLFRRDWVTGGCVLLMTSMFGLVAFGLSALAVLPALDMLGWTARTQISYDDAAKYSLNLNALSGFFSPALFGRGPNGFWGAWDRTEVGYVGTLTLVLAVLGLAKTNTANAANKLLPNAFLFLLMFFGLALAVGNATPLHTLAYRHLPAFQSVRAPARFLLFTSFGIALFAAHGLSALQYTMHHKRIRPVLVAFGLVGVVGIGVLWLARTNIANAHPELATPEHLAESLRAIALFAGAIFLGLCMCVSAWRGWLPQKFLGGAIFVLLLADLVGLGAMTETERNNPVANYDHPEVIAFLRNDPDIASGNFRIEGDSHFWQPNTAQVHRLHDVGGIVNPLALGLFSTYRWAYGEKGAPLYDLLGVKYLLWDKGFLPADRSFELVFESDQIGVLKNTQALPRVQILSQILSVENGEQAFAKIHELNFDPAQQLVLLNTAPAINASSPNPNARAKIVRDTGNTYTVEAETSAPAYLFIADIFYPGWFAYVDGIKTDIQQANFAFRAVRLPAGKHIIEIKFEPASWRTGLTITSATLCILGMLAFAFTIRHIRQARS